MPQNNNQKPIQNEQKTDRMKVAIEFTGEEHGKFDWMYDQFVPRDKNIFFSKIPEEDKKIKDWLNQNKIHPSALYEQLCLTYETEKRKATPVKIDKLDFGKSFFGDFGIDTKNMSKKDEDVLKQFFQSSIRAFYEDHYCEEFDEFIYIYDYQTIIQKLKNSILSFMNSCS